jgi:sterol desaturase/sphingolipid hydroxylase (fatty acid hydroxylase superfamily)
MPLILLMISPQTLTYMKRALLAHFSTAGKEIQHFPDGMWYGLKAYLFCLPIIYAIERFTGQKTSQYRTRNFANDTFFFVVINSSGILNLFFAVPAMVTGWVLVHTIPLHPLPIIEKLPLALRYLTLWMAWDFIGYWLHRLFHASRLLWPFHAMHHSQEVLTFAAGDRVHPVEQVVHYTFKSIPTILWGANPVIWFPISFFLRSFLDNLQHTEIPWRYGPLYRVFVGPAFHSFHHSVEKRHYDKNFGINFAFWDFLFGTGIDEPERNRVYGLDEPYPETLTSLMLEPFQRMWTELRGRRSGDKVTANEPKAAAATAGHGGAIAE